MKKTIYTILIWMKTALAKLRTLISKLASNQHSKKSQSNQQLIAKIRSQAQSRRNRKITRGPKIN